MNKITIILVLGYLFSQPGSHNNRENANMIRKWKLIEHLNLKESQSEDFFVRINSFESELKTIHKQKRELRDELDTLLKKDNIKQKAVNKLLDEFFDLEKNTIEKRRQHHKEIGNILTAEQKIKYATFDHHFKKKLKDHVLDRKGPGKHRQF